MAIAKSIGHNKNGKPLYKTDAQTGEEVLDDDIPAVTRNFVKRKENSVEASRLGFRIAHSDLNENIFIPEYYNPEISRELSRLKDSGKYNLVSIGYLIAQEALQIKRGNEIGSRHYGTGEVPFVRTSDIVNWEIKFDPIKSVSEDVYEKYRASQDIQAGDVLFVSDGTFLIGRTAIVTDLDKKIIIQSHLKKIRGLQRDSINPYYLFYLLNNKIVRKQVDAKTFVQATISTIGNRLSEVVLPISADPREVKGIITAKSELRKRALGIIDSSV